MRLHEIGPDLFRTVEFRGVSRGLTVRELTWLLSPSLGNIVGLWQRDKNFGNKVIFDGV